MSKASKQETISNILMSLLAKVGIRKINHNFTGRERFSVPLNHGYRKWWMGQAVNAKMQPEIREMLLSHSIGLASAYYKPSEDEILGEYMKAIDKGFFAISEEMKLKRKVEKLEVEKTQFEQLRAKIESLEQKIR